MKKPVIICVDDEKIVLDSLKKELGSAFSKMTTIEIAESGEEALELLEELMDDNYDIPLIISDWLMPGMKGDDFLIKAYELLPGTRKIMLTGQATTEGVGNAVNKAKLYRYIAKPWQSEDMELTVTEAFKSYYKDSLIKKQKQELIELNKSLEQKVVKRTMELNESNKELEQLYDHTLKATINILIEVLSKVSPLVFEKSLRMRKTAKLICTKLNLKKSWDIEISCLFSQLGSIDLNESIVTAYYTGQPLNQNQKSIFNTHPQKTHELISKIPNLKDVARGILFHLEDNDEIEARNLDNTPAFIAKILRLCTDFDFHLLQNNSEESVIRKLYKMKDLYDPVIFEALSDVLKEKHRSGGDSSGIVQVTLNDLKVGMTLANNILSKSGDIAYETGEEITQDVLEVLMQMRRRDKLVDMIYINKK